MRVKEQHIKDGANIIIHPLNGNLGNGSLAVNGGIPLLIIYPYLTGIRLAYRLKGLACRVVQQTSPRHQDGNDQQQDQRPNQHRSRLAALK
ncbi:hypothetical protein ACE3MQ_22630 [Paenibacillus lentus]|uniref:hypothetical protein n=1 Tax=Paenibacillus lentus TaxID=1338368 RepID=UPI003648FD58